MTHRHTRARAVGAQDWVRGAFASKLAPSRAESGKTQLARAVYRYAIGAGLGETVDSAYSTIAWATRLFKLLR